MASTEKYRDSTGKDAWAARWRNADGKQSKKRGFPSEAKARKYGQAQEVDVQRGVGVVSSTWTVAEYARHWAASRPHRALSAARVESAIKHHIEATPLGRRKLTEVRQSEIQTWLTDRASHLKPATLKLTVALLKAIYKTAQEDGLVAKSPAAGRLQYPTTRPVDVEFVPLTVEQVRCLADAMPPQYRAMILVQAGLGLRMGELLALRVQDVNFLKRQVKIDWQLSNEKGAKRGQRVELKTTKSHRTIPMGREVAGVLAQHIATYGVGEDGSLWQTNRGKPPMHQHYGQKLFKTAAAKAGLPVETTSHDLRHHFASIMLERGLTHDDVADLLGHEDATLVIRTYGHSMPGAAERARKAMDAAWVEPVAEEAG